MKKYVLRLCLILVLICTHVFMQAQQNKPAFKVLGFYTAENDLAHISFVHEANQWFTKMAMENNFVYDSTKDWNNLNDSVLSKYNVILFLDTRPESGKQRRAFEKYMQHGGAWMGFHFAGFSLDSSSFLPNWNWYHETFLGAGQYKGNTWRPTSAILRKEDSIHPAMKSLPQTFRSAPNEWYSWENDLRKNPDIQVLLSIDSSSFPLGTGPKPYEIWHSGYYPVVWTKKKFNMLYVNMGHNDMDYEGGTNRALSSTFSSEAQNQMLLNGLLWLGAITTKTHSRKN